jgi:hypothetical protein
MCIPINLNVPVVTDDQHEIGIARDIMCACPGDHAAHGSTTLSMFDTSADGSLWLRVTRPALPDLFIPFGEIAETRSDGVRLHVSAEDLALRGWERPPVSLPVPA